MTQFEIDEVADKVVKYLLANNLPLGDEGTLRDLITGYLAPYRSEP